MQRRVAGKLIAMIESAWLPGMARVLELGCGTGWLTELLCERLPNASIYASDIAPAMVTHARKKRRRASRAHWFVADGRNVATQKPFDMIVSSSSLHWMSPLELTLGNIATLLAPRGRLVCATMVEGTLVELREARKRVAPKKSPQRQLPAAEAVACGLKKVGLRVTAQRVDRMTALFKTPVALLRSLHRQGVTGGDVSRGGAPLTRRELDRLAGDYERNYRTSSGEVGATYAVLSFVAESERKESRC